MAVALAVMLGLTSRRPGLLGSSSEGGGGGGREGAGSVKMSDLLGDAGEKEGDEGGLGWFSLAIILSCGSVRGRIFGKVYLVF